MREFALIWQALPKVVFSRTLDSVEGANTTLARDDLRAEVTSLQESVRGDVAVGGAELAAEAARLDLIDEYRLFVHPVAVGGGIPFFPRDRRRHGTGRDAHVQLARRVPEIPRGRPMTLRRANCAPTGAARHPARCSTSQRLKELLGERARQCGRPRVSQ